MLSVIMSATCQQHVDTYVHSSENVLMRFRKISDLIYDVHACAYFFFIIIIFFFIDVRAYACASAISARVCEKIA